MRRGRHTPVAVLLSAVVAAACTGGLLVACSASAPSSTSPEAAPPAGETGNVATVSWPGGSARMCLLVADTDAERTRGLSARDELAPFDGMLFVFDRPDSYRFWMKDTTLPLDLVPIDDEGRLGTPIAMQPCGNGDGGECPTYGPPAPFSRALELPPGYVTGRGIDAPNARFVLDGEACPVRR